MHPAKGMDGPLNSSFNERLNLWGALIESYVKDEDLRKKFKDVIERQRKFDIDGYIKNNKATKYVAACTVYCRGKPFRWLCTNFRWPQQENPQ